MFHVKPQHFLKTVLTVPGVGSAIHVAELAEIDATRCRMLRLIELSPDETIMGVTDGAVTAGLANTPAEVVPHPDTYDNYPDITATRLSKQEFEALWHEAVAKFPQLRSDTP